ncbi:hypothetical protein MKZ01_01680 [Lysinibacillus endophyticus]|nr:hypothetical protein [Lysinibacillus endophyticus]
MKKVVLGLICLLIFTTACTDNGDETPVETNSTNSAVNAGLEV